MSAATFPSQNIEQLSINTIRTLSMDGVQTANSGRPGTPMALAPVAYCLWQHYLRFDPQDPVQASDFGWSKYTGLEGHNICIETFGASAPLKQLQKKFGFNVEHIVAVAKRQLTKFPAVEGP